MFEQWWLKDFAAGEGLATGAERNEGDGGWIDVDVPGDTYVALSQAGRIAAPFEQRHENDAAWVGAREWWWRTTFDAAITAVGERVELLFEGLDTFASIYLDGVLLGSTDNMFRSYRFDISEQLRKDGPHQLAIAFAPATQTVAHRDMPLWGPMSDKINASKRNFIRKAQFGWGWDFAPNLPTVGIWQPVRLERHRQGRIADVHFSTLALNDRQAEVRIDAKLDHIDSATTLQYEFVLLDPQSNAVARRTTPADAQAHALLQVPQPQRWWTADLGAQPLYTVVVRLLDGEVEIDRKQLRVGLRTIVLDTSADEAESGTHFFRFVLNGVPIFARGANWVPASSFVGAIDAARYRGLLEQAVQANMNMLRVWGGGIYEHEVFYDLCDQHGLLVWQDFMFACTPYPEDDAAFVDNVRQEARDQITRLRHHASLALWCGNNECQVLQGLANMMTGSKDSSVLGALYYDRILPEALAELDPATSYWPGSPSGGPSPNSMRAGDVHSWTVWHGFPPVPDQHFAGPIDRSPAGIAYTRYAEDMTRFASEFGIQSSASAATLRRWMAPEDLQLDSAGFLERIKDNPKDKVNGMLLPVTGLPTTLQEYIDFTMLVQAEGMKFGIEHFRRRKPHCSGTLIWQLNDCWPCVSWSLIDYDGVAKAALYASARAYAPLLASFKRVDDANVELWISNDRLSPASGTAVIELLRFAGGCDLQITVPYEVPANASIAVWHGAVAKELKDRVLCVHSAEERFASNRLLLAPVKDLALVAGARAEVRFEQIALDQLRVQLTTSSYLLNVGLSCERAGIRFSDNYFDLRPGELRTVVIRAESGALPASDVSIQCWNQHRR